MSPPNPDFEAGYMTTYRQADGKPIYGEYDFVLHEEFWEGCTERTIVKQEKWVRIASTVRHFGVPLDEDEVTA